MFKRLSKELYPLHLWNIYFHRCRGFCSLLMVKHLYFAFHICEIKLLLFLHLYTSAGGFCDHLLDSSNLVIWHKKMHDHLVCVLRVKDRKLILCCNILQLADSRVICSQCLGNPMVLLYHRTLPQASLHCSGIGSHKSAGTKEHTAKISGHNYRHIINIFPQDHIQHRPSCSS